MVPVLTRVGEKESRAVKHGFLVVAVVEGRTWDEASPRARAGNGERIRVYYKARRNMSQFWGLGIIDYCHFVCNRPKVLGRCVLTETEILLSFLFIPSFSILFSSCLFFLPFLWWTNFCGLSHFSSLLDLNSCARMWGTQKERATRKAIENKGPSSNR